MLDKTIADKTIRAIFHFDRIETFPGNHKQKKSGKRISLNWASYLKFLSISVLCVGFLNPLSIMRQFWILKRSHVFSTFCFFSRFISLMGSLSSKFLRSIFEYYLKPPLKELFEGKCQTLNLQKFPHTITNSTRQNFGTKWTCWRLKSIKRWMRQSVKNKSLVFILANN